MSDSTKFVLKNLAAGVIAWAGGEIAKRTFEWWEASLHEGEEDPLGRIEAQLERIEERLTAPEAS